MELERKFLVSYVADTKNLIHVLNRKVGRRFFQSDVQGLLFDLLTWFVQKYQKFPSVDELELLLNNSRKINFEVKPQILLSYQELIKEPKTNESFDFLLSSFVQEYQKNLLKDTLMRAADDYKAKDIDNVLKDLRSKVTKIELISHTDIKAGPLADSADERWDEYIKSRDYPDLTKGVPFGFPTFDNITGGLRKGQLMIVMAAMKEGKSVFLLNSAWHAHKRGKNILFVTIEMNKDQVERRYDSRDSDLFYSAIRDGKLTQQEEKIYQKCLDQQKNNSGIFFVYDTFRISAEGIKAQLRELDFPVDLLVVDYLGIMESDQRGGENWEKIGRIAGELKALAKELCIPVLTAAQVNRGGVKNKGNKYEIEDVGLSFLILAHCDIAMSIRIVDREELEVSDVIDMVAAVIANRDDQNFKFQVEACFKKITMKEKSLFGGTHARSENP